MTIRISLNTYVQILKILKQPVSWNCVTNKRTTCEHVGKKWQDLKEEMIEKEKERKEMRKEKKKIQKMRY